MSEGGSGAAAPDPSIEVHDLDEALARMKKANIAIEYRAADEPRASDHFSFAIPLGKLVNILAHQPER